MMILDERNYLKPELLDKGFNVFDFFDLHEVINLKDFCALPLKRRGDVLLVDTQTLLNHPELQENFKTLMNTFMGVVFFHDHANPKASEWVEIQAAFLTKIVGEYSLPMPSLQWTMLSNQLQFFWTILEEQKKLQRHMIQFSSELDQVLQNAEVEMSKAKRIHEVLVPKRQQEIKGVEFSHRYLGGDGGHGEFYDLISNGQKVFQILVSSQSYLISSSLMGILLTHKQKDFEPHAFVQDALNEAAVVNNSKKKKSEVHIMVLELDLAHLSLKSIGRHKSEVYSQSRGALDLTEPQTLTRDEKIIVFSPGFLFNWNEGRHISDLHTFVQGQRHLGSQELLSETFYHMSHDFNQGSLKKDATVVVMEVNRHGIHQV